RTEVLCYAHDVGRLRGAVRAAATKYAGALHNPLAADRLGVDVGSRYPIAVASKVQELMIESPGYGTRVGAPPNSEIDLTDPGGGWSCWEELVGLYGRDLPLARLGVDLDGEMDVAYSGEAHLVRFTDAQPVFFRDDVAVTVYIPDASEDEPTLLSVLPGNL